MVNWLVDENLSQPLMVLSLSDSWECGLSGGRVKEEDRSSCSTIGI